MRKSYFIIILSLWVFGCNRTPFGRTMGGTVIGGAPSGPASNAFVIFNNELSSGGGAFEYPGDDNQSLTFNDASNPISRDSIRYSWTGGDVSGCPFTNDGFAGFDLMDTPSFTDYSSTPGKNLSGAGYTKVTFFARGTLSASTVMKVEVAGDGVAPGCPAHPPHVPCVTLSTNGMDDDIDNPCGMTKQLTAGWQQYSISVTPADLQAVKDYFKATYVNTASPTAGQGGTVYFDAIEYQP